MLVNGNTAIEGLPGKGNGRAGGIAAEGAWGRTERYCTRIIIPTKSPSPATATPIVSGDDRWKLLVFLGVAGRLRGAAPTVFPAVSSSTIRHTRTGSAMFLTLCSPRSS